MKLTYQGLVLTIPCKTAIQVEYFCLKEALNHHAELEIQLLMGEGDALSMIEGVGEKDNIRVEEGGKALFTGMPLYTGMERRGELALVTCRSASYTYQWDMEKHSRSFCDLASTYQEVIEGVLAPYGQKGIQNIAGRGKKIPGFLLQYEETDWAFLKRLASHFETFLLPEAGEAYGRFFFGMPGIDHGTRLKKGDVDLCKDLGKYYYFNTLDDYFPQETIRFHVATKERLYLGEELLYGGTRVQVTACLCQSRRGELVQTYELSRRKGVRCPYQTNPEIYGMSIPAVIKERTGNQVRVHFSIDPVYKPGKDQKYFTYAIESSNFYCMPEIGSQAHVYFPGNDEKDAIVVHAIRTGAATGGRNLGGKPVLEGTLAPASAPTLAPAPSAPNTPAPVADPVASGATGSPVCPAGDSSAPKTFDPDEKSFSDPGGSEMLLGLTCVSFVADKGNTIQLLLEDAGRVTAKGRQFTLGAQKDILLGEREGTEAAPPAKPRNLTISAGEKLGLHIAGEEDMGITLEEEALVLAIFLKKEASVKRPPSIPLSSFDHSAEDVESIIGQNMAAEAQLAAKRDEGAAKVRRGLMGALKAVGVAVTVVAIAATAVVTAPLAIGTTVLVGLAAGTVAAGGVKLNIGMAETSEGIDDYGKSQRGDLRMGHNPIRDTYFAGREEEYYKLKAEVDMTFGLVSSLALMSLPFAIGGKLAALTTLCGSAKKAKLLSFMGIQGLSSIYDSYMADGKVDMLNLGLSMGTGFIAGSIGSYGTNIALNALKGSSKTIAKVMATPLGRKAVVVVADTGVGMAVDYTIAKLNKQEYDVVASAMRNGAAAIISILFGEPVDAATGAYLFYATDYAMPGIQEPFYLKREYCSIGTGTGHMGKGWRHSFESQLYRDGDGIHLRSVTGHQMKFCLKDGDWENQTTGCGQFTLRVKPDGQFLFTDNHAHKAYTYSVEGLLLCIEDANGAKTGLTYGRGGLEGIQTPTGQELTVLSKGGRVLQITDGAKRILQYRYEGNLLTDVVHLDQGTTHYTYSGDGYLA